MTWNKKGLIYHPPNDGTWRDNSSLTPTAFLLNDDIIRIYVSFRDRKGVGRIGFVDVRANNPCRVVKISDKPVLSVGRDGMFDDNGVILGDVIRVNNEVYMYYVGFQLVNSVKFLAFSGLAISSDNGESFKRYSETPIFDRSNEALYIRAIHSVLLENNKFMIWYAVGNGWETIGDARFPQYDINYIESKNGISLSGNGVKCIEVNKNNQEYRIGRPRVYKENDLYIMNFTYGTIDGRYRAGQASSKDGINWSRNDNDIGIQLSTSGWDSKHLSYPSILKSYDKVYMFYNGNDMGINGFGYAEKMIRKL